MHGSLNAQPPLTRLREEDKQKHFWYSFAILLVSLAVMTFSQALVLTLLAGIAKEIWDHLYGTGWCWYDMAANLAGMGLASVLAGGTAVGGR